MSSFNISHISVVVVGNDDAEPFRPSETFVSNEGRHINGMLVDLCLSFIIANVGIVSNVIIIVVFARQGYGESMNISMTAIALWDLLKCISGSIQRMSGPISLVSQAEAESWQNIMAAAMNHFISVVTYVSSVLAAYVAVERCLCVTLPFTVKTLLTPKVTLIAMVSLSTIVFGCFAIIFSVYEIVWVHSPKWNTTVAIYRYNGFYKAHKGPLMQHYNLSGVIWPCLSFAVIIVCTVIIFHQLRKASKFRSDKTSSGSNPSSSLSQRDRQVIKMLLVIIIIYIICLFPRVAIYMAKFFVFELYFLRKYHNLFWVIAHWSMLFDFINATANLFVFLTMSTNFRATTKELFGFGSKDLKKTSSDQK